MPTGIPEPIILEKNGKKEKFPSIRKAWLEKLRGHNDSYEKISQFNREKVRMAIKEKTQINGYNIEYE
jgi:hypothetical protein